MPLAPRPIVVAAAFFIVGCNPAPTTAPPGSGSPTAVALATAASAPDVDATLAAFVAAIPSISAQSPGRADVRLDQINLVMGVSEALGEPASDVLALAAAVDDAARAQQPFDPFSSGTTAGPGPVPDPPAPDGSTVNALPIPVAPPPDGDIRDILATGVQRVGLPGPTTAHIDTETGSISLTEGQLTGTLTLSQPGDMFIAGSMFTIELNHDAHTVVVDTKTGVVVYDSTQHMKTTAQLDVCPSADGVVFASVEHSFTIDTQTYPGVLGKVGTHMTGTVTSTSTFGGQVDDNAVLGKVSQDYVQSSKWKRSAAASGGPELTHEGNFDTAVTGIGAGVPVAHDWSVGIGDWSNVRGTMSVGGDTKPETYYSSLFAAGLDFTTVDSAFIEAQKLFRNGRCVMVTSPTYNVETPFEVHLQDSVRHTEDVERSSSTPFQAALKHRFGASVNAPITVTLVTGSESIDPTLIPSPPGTITYVAPAEEGKEAHVKLVSTSRQGIGTLVLAFRTKAGNWKTEGTASGSMLKGQKCGGLDGLWEIDGKITGGGLSMDATFRVTINGTTGAGTYTVKEVGSVLGGTFVTTITGAGTARIAMQADGTILMTLDKINATSTAVGAGTKQTTKVQLPGWTFTWTAGGTCPTA